MNAIIAGLSYANDRYDIDYSLNELKNLAETLDFVVVARFHQKKDKPDPKTYIGKGKLAEIKIAVTAYDAKMIIMNDELSASQLRNIETELQINCIDRSYLILKIFEARANTKEAQLEIKLAKYLYLLPRVSYLREKESRSGGTSGALSSKGAGETQKELDKRHLMQQIYKIKDQLKKAEAIKENQIKKRKQNQIPMVALVGYTNAGKSSVMNTLLNHDKEKQVIEKDQLFSTLSTYNRKITYRKKEFILTDTIGFVSKLPTFLVHSFYQTLKEIEHADFIIHVIDASSNYFQEQIEVVRQVLLTLKADSIPSLLLLNKQDLLQKETFVLSALPTLSFSNRTKLHVKELLDMIVSNIPPSTVRAKFILPYTEGKQSHLLERTAYIYKKEYLDYGIYYDVELPIHQYIQFKQFDLENMVS